MSRQAWPWRQRAPIILAIFGAVFILAGLNDYSVAEAVAREPRLLNDIGMFISRFGLSGYMLATSAAIVLYAALVQREGGSRVWGMSPTYLGERAAFFFVAIAGSGIVCQTIKHAIGRARPKLLHHYGAFHFEALSWRSAIDSFPSGHSTTVFAAAVVCGLFYPPGRIVFFALAALVGVARILAGAHFPSDVVAGAALGTLSALWLAHVFATRNIAFLTDATGIVLKREGASSGSMSSVTS